jgi:hypothetical protein
MMALSSKQVWTSKQIMDIGMRENRNVWLRGAVLDKGKDQRHDSLLPSRMGTGSR